LYATHITRIWKPWPVILKWPRNFQSCPPLCSGI
jgi:hypothetical protein